MNWKEIKEHYQMTVKNLSKRTGVPKRTLEDWIAGRRTPPDYITKLLIEKLEETLEGQKRIEEEENPPKKLKVAIDDILDDIPYPSKTFSDWTLYDELEDIQTDIELIAEHQDEIPEKYIKRLSKIIDRLERILE